MTGCIVGSCRGGFFLFLRKRKLNDNLEEKVNETFSYF